MNKKISEISQRAKFIFKVLVENYLSTGQPMGSKSIQGVPLTTPTEIAAI